MKIGLSSVCLMALANGSVALAAPAPDSAAAPVADAALETTDIVVTANKRSQNLMDVPMSVTALSGDQLERRGINSVQDLVKVTPGLSYVESGNAVPVYSLRGVGFFDTSIGARPTVSIYVDEAPLPFSIMTAGSSFDLDRVEVLKGPQGTLFGQNATGGAINYIAAKPRDEFEAGLTGIYSRFNTVDVKGYVTGPLAPNLNARLAVRGVSSSGWQYSTSRDDTLGDQRFVQGRFLLDWEASDRLSMTLQASGFSDQSDTQAGQFAALYPSVPRFVNDFPELLAAVPPPANNRAADWTPGEDLRRHNKFYQTSLRVEYALSDAIKLTSLTAYSHMTIDQTTDGDGLRSNNALAHVTGKVSSLSQELRLSGDTGPLSWIVGGNYSRDKSLESNVSTFIDGTSSLVFSPGPVFSQVAPYGRQRFDVSAVFGNVDWNLTDKIIAHAGVRYTDTKLNYATCTRVANVSSGQGSTSAINRIRTARGLAPIADLLPGECYSLGSNFLPGELTGNLNQNNVSWRAGVDFKPTDDALLYVNVSKGYKAGSIPVTVALTLSQIEPISQESVLAYEAGLKLSLADRKVDLSGAVFHYNYVDKQLKGRLLFTPNLFGPAEALINIPKSEITGAEAQVTIQPVRGLRLTGAGTYLESKVKGSLLNYSILATQQDFGGSAFPYTPKWQLVFDGEYRFPVGSELTALLGANVNYRSATKAGFGSEAVLDIDSYALLDLRAGIEAQNGKWGVQLFGKNVTNKYYWTNVAKFFDVARRLTGQPATYGIQLTTKF